jgi:hypothetical protein
VITSLGDGCHGTKFSDKGMTWLLQQAFLCNEGWKSKATRPCLEFFGATTTVLPIVLVRLQAGFLRQESGRGIVGCQKRMLPSARDARV